MAIGLGPYRIRLQGIAYDDMSQVAHIIGMCMELIISSNFAPDRGIIYTYIFTSKFMHI